jgi:ferric-dicitrate binding protein FerR (iron transport regulator)
LVEDNKHIDLIIARFIAGEATEQEITLLNQWLSESEVNRKYFGDIQFVNQKAVASHTINKVDVDKAWSRVHQQMKKVEPEPTAKIVPFQVPVWLRVAAVLVIVSGISFGLYRYYSSTLLYPTEMVAAASKDSVITKSLVDSSTVSLNKNSKITYAKNYGKKDRRLKLEGEAFFDVKHIDDKPFIVEAEGTLIEDIGTSFNIKAVDTDTIVEVIVKSGEVVFFTKDNKGISLTAGEMGIYNKNTRTFTKISVPDVNATSYVNKVFFFQNVRLADVVQQLNMVYNANIRFGNEQLKDCTISVKFENEDIDLILSIICETLDLTVVKDAEGYIINGEACKED